MQAIVAADHPRFCAEVSALLRNELEIQTLGEAHRGDDLLNLVQWLRPGLVVTEFELPDMNSTALIRHLKAGTPPPCVIVVGRPEDQVAAVRAGADGFVIRSNVPALALLLRGLGVVPATALAR